MEISDTLSTFIRNIAFDDLPPSVISKAKDTILDSMGIAIRGSLTPEALIVRGALAKVSGLGDSTVIADEQRVSSRWAAFANAVAINSLELDDTCNRTYCHPSTVIVPVVLALGEATEASGKEMLTSLVVGYEITLRVAAAACSHRAQGFAITGTTGTFGAAAAAGKLLGLSERQLTHALGLAGSIAPLSLLEFLSDGAMSKVIYAGMAAHNGILSAMLALEGVTGPQSIIEGPFGFLAVTSGVKNKPTLVSRDLGQKFAISRVSFKPYACCRHFHGAIDCLLELREKMDPKELALIEKIIIRSNALAIKGHDCPSPDTVQAAQQSFPYVCAIALLEGTVSIDDFSMDQLKDPDRCTLANKVHLIVDQDMNRNLPFSTLASVEILLRDGNRLQCHSDAPLGNPEKPLTGSALVAKFLGLTSAIIGAEKQNNLIETIYSLESIRAKDLGRLLCFRRHEE